MSIWVLGMVVCSMIRRDHGVNCFVYSCHVDDCLFGCLLSTERGGFLKLEEDSLWFLMLSTGMWLLLARKCWFSRVVVALVSHLCRDCVSFPDMYHVRPLRKVIVRSDGS